MHLTKLYVRDFRNYEEAVLECDPSINIFFGANAQGKTSLLEAIHLLMIGRSFRTIQSSELIRHGSEGFYVEVHFIRHGIEQKLRLWNNGQERRLIYNTTDCPSLASVLGVLPGIVMTPDDELIKGPPHSRRHFLDLQISQTDPLYVHYLSRYHRAMRQRNQLLRNRTLLSIESWEQEMATAAAYLSQKRKKTVVELQQECQRLSPLLSDENKLFEISYLCRVCPSDNLEQIRQSYTELFQKSRDREVTCGNTLYGPHRDELDIQIGGQEVRSFGSEGQKRTCVSMLRFASWELLKQKVEEPPLMLIDDIGISLDQQRKRKLMEHLNGMGQVFISSAQSLPLLQKAKTYRYFHITQGKIELCQADTLEQLLKDA